MYSSFYFHSVYACDFIYLGVWLHSIGHTSEVHLHYHFLKLNSLVALVVECVSMGQPTDFDLKLLSLSALTVWIEKGQKCYMGNHRILHISNLSIVGKRASDGVTHFSHCPARNPLFLNLQH